MRGVLCLCAALALWPVAPGAAPPRVHPDHIKRQILAKLGLSTRPTPLRAPPRDVVRQILAHAAADDAPPAHHHDDHNTREIIAIAQRGETLNGQRLIEYRLAREAGEQLRVLSAEVLVRAEGARGAGGATLWAFGVEGGAGNVSVGALAGVARRDPRAAWQRLDVTRAAQRWASSGSGGPLRLLLDCSGCAGRVRLRLGGGQAARPLLRLRVEAPPRRRRRALDCGAAPRGHCCRQTYYVSFRSLGWDDWIVAPEGYHANYCRGACSRVPFAFPNNHAQVAEAAQLQLAACCAPLRFSALSLIYFGENSNIIKRDLPEMVVEECGCP